MAARINAAFDALPAGMRVLAEEVVDKARRIAEAHPDWPLLALPLAFCEAYEVAAERLLAGALLFYAAADVIDDAQDGDLEPAVWGDPPWVRAVNVGDALVFAALGEFLAAAPPEARGAMAGAVAAAGLRMTAGQHRDFDLGPVGRAFSEQEYLDCIEGKSGGSLGLFCRAAGIAARLPEADLDRLELVGKSVGAAVQLRSDMAEIWTSGRSRDLAAGRRTLPVLYGLAAADAQGRERIMALLQEPERKPELIARLDALGAGPYCDMRLAAYCGQAQAALDGLGLPPERRAALAALVASHGRPRWGLAI